MSESIVSSIMRRQIKAISACMDTMPPEMTEDLRAALRELEARLEEVEAGYLCNGGTDNG